MLARKVLRRVCRRSNNFEFACGWQSEDHEDARVAGERRAGGERRTRRKEDVL